MRIESESDRSLREARESGTPVHLFIPNPGVENRNGRIYSRDMLAAVLPVYAEGLLEEAREAMRGAADAALGVRENGPPEDGPQHPGVQNYD
jgi:hypothetical protein